MRIQRERVMWTVFQQATQNYYSSDGNILNYCNIQLKLVTHQNLVDNPSFTGILELLMAIYCVYHNLQQYKFHISTAASNFNYISKWINMADPCSSLLRLAAETQLNDPWLQNYSHHQDFSIQNMGSKCINSIFILPGLRGYTSWFISWIHNITIIWRHHWSNARCPIQRCSIEGSIVYHNLHWEMSQSSWCKWGIKKLTDLQQDKLTTQQVETMDILVGQGGPHTESVCKCIKPKWYSRALTQ